jgi:hypothetical protein
VFGAALGAGGFGGVLPGYGCSGDEGAVGGGGVAVADVAPGALDDVPVAVVQPPKCTAFA